MTAGSERSNEGFVRNALTGTRFANVRWVAETGSTNDDLLALARAGAPEQVLITDLQTSGRGRRGRVWEAPSGSGILMSVLLRGRVAKDPFWAVGAIALAASQTIDGLIDAPCTLKWPNDVIVADNGDPKKIAGVLAQVADDAVIVGIGINARWPDEMPAEIEARGTTIDRHWSPPHDRPMERAPIAAEILNRAIGHLAAEPETLRQAWASQCSTIGQHIRLELDDGEIVGIAVGVAPDGALQIEEDGQLSVHQVGDVVHLRPAI